MINVFCGGVMKINLLVLALASILLSSPVSASRVDVDFDYPGKPMFDVSEKIPNFIFDDHHFNKDTDKPVFNFTGRFNPHQGHELAGMRNFHAEGKGQHGLILASAQISAVPVPAAVWLFLSGLAGMIGVSCRRKQHKF